MSRQKPKSTQIVSLQVYKDILCAHKITSSLAKGFAHGPLSLHPWQTEQDFVIPADRHIAVFKSPAYEDDITFDQWVLLTDSCLGRCKMAALSVYIFDCIHVMFP